MHKKALWELGRKNGASPYRKKGWGPNQSIQRGKDFRNLERADGSTCGKKKRAQRKTFFSSREEKEKSPFGAPREGERGGIYYRKSSREERGAFLCPERITQDLQRRKDAPKAAKKKNVPGGKNAYFSQKRKKKTRCRPPGRGELIR